MYDVMRAVYLEDTAVGAADVADRLDTALAGIDSTSGLVAPTLAGARNGGDVIVRLRFDSAEHWERHRPAVDSALEAPGIDRVVGAAYDPDDSPIEWSGRRAGAGGPGVYRLLLARVADDAHDDEVDRFEQALLRMPAHVPQIRSWRLSRAAGTTGPTAWTHVWEQEYDELDGLLGAYMNHPIHWAHVDQWFDPESPRWLVRDRVVHTFCDITAPVLITG